MISFFVMDDGTHGRSFGKRGGGAAKSQTKIAHVAEPKFKQAPQQDGEVFETTGKRDSLDHEFESF